MSIGPHRDARLLEAQERSVVAPGRREGSWPVRYIISFQSRNRRRFLFVFVSNRARGRGVGDETDWPALLNHYQAAVKNFESVSAALTEALSAQYPLGGEFLDLIEAEERVRETVILTRIRLINLWRDSVDETKPLPFVSPTDRTDKR